LLDRTRMPGGVIKRHPCSEDASSDLSLLGPESQPQFGTRGPVSVFGPYTEVNAMFDQARSRTTAAYFHAATGENYLFVTGSSKRGKNFSIDTPPGLARIRIVTAPAQPAYLRVDQSEQTQTFQNPGSPIVTSMGGRNAIAWVLDMNAPRLASLYGTQAPRPILYAFDASSLRLLWKSAPGVLFPSGKYNEPTVANGTVFVGTDRVQAFGIRGEVRLGEFDSQPVLDHQVVTHAEPAASSPALPDGKAVQTGKALYRQRCAACHSEKDSGAPPQEDLTQLPHGQIVDVLENGVMRNMALGLSQEDIQSLATYLISPAAIP
jgi:Cytochrome C oxidase, cbb3-type, subunit III